MFRNMEEKKSSNVRFEEIPRSAELLAAECRDLFCILGQFLSTRQAPNDN